MGSSLGITLDSDNASPSNESLQALEANTTHLHWLLSDETRIQEAFQPVWQACTFNEASTSSSREDVLAVIVRFLQEFDEAGKSLHAAENRSGAGAADIGAYNGVDKISLQLRHIVESMPQELTRPEALDLFRTTLLSVQAALVTRPVTFAARKDATEPNGIESSWSLPTLQRGISIETSLTLASAPNSRAGSGVEDGLARMPQRGAAPLAVGNANQPFPPPWSLSVGVLEGGLSQLLASTALLLPGTPLPSRKELETENSRLGSLCKIVRESTLEEANLISVLEDEELNGIGTFVSDMSLEDWEREMKSAQDGVRRLDAELRECDNSLHSVEASVSANRGEIAALSSERAEEEVVVENMERDIRDIALELKGFARLCASLESEVASEEARAAAYREAFEGRRCRFATAESAAQNAELSTLRTTRRRIAAERATQYEESIVDEARHKRAQLEMTAASSLDALRAEIRAVSSHSSRIEALMRQASELDRDGGPRDNVTFSEVSSDLSGALTEIEENASALAIVSIEVSEMEAVRAQLLTELAEQELFDGRPDVEIYRLVGGEVGAEEVGARTRQLRLHGAPSPPTNASDASTDASISNEVLVADERWMEARALGAEVGEASATLMRKQIDAESHGTPNEVVTALRKALGKAEGRQAQSCTELAAIHNRVVAALEERTVLLGRIAAMERPDSRAVGA